MKKIIPFIFIMFFTLSSVSLGAETYYSPDQSLNTLKQGNLRFFSGKQLTPRRDKEQREGTAGAQQPKAVILACSDSRVPVVSIFDHGIGDVMVLRVPGNTAGQDVQLGIWYAVNKLQVPLVVVLGHSNCDVINDVARGELASLFPDITKSVSALKAEKKLDDMREYEFLQQLAIKNVQTSIDTILERQPGLAGLIADNRLRIVGAVYNLESGLVEWLDY